MTSSPLSQNLNIWKTELLHDIDNSFIINGLSHGFTVMSADISSENIECENYKSVTSIQNRPRVEEQLSKEIALGRYQICVDKPKIISALGAVPKPNSSELRLIHDCSRPKDKGLNSYAIPDKFSFSSVDSAVQMITPNAWMAKLDLKSAYRHVPLHPSQYPATGLKFKFSGDL